MLGDGGAGDVAMTEGFADSPTRARDASISSCVRFLDWRKAIRLSKGALATMGSCRTVVVNVQSVGHSLAVVLLNVQET